MYMPSSVLLVDGSVPISERSVRSRPTFGRHLYRTYPFGVGLHCTAVIDIEIEKTKNLGMPSGAWGVIEDRNSSGSC